MLSAPERWAPSLDATLLGSGGGVVVMVLSNPFLYMSARKNSAED